MSKSGNEFTEMRSNKKGVNDGATSRTPFYKLTPTWSFKYCDSDHKEWGIKVNQKYLPKLIERMRDWERGTWGDILTVTSGRNENTQSHEIDVSRISKEAKDRLIALGHNDTMTLYSLSVTGKQRTWGSVDTETGVFHLIWYDPMHTVYKVSPRGT